VNYYFPVHNPGTTATPPTVCNANGNAPPGADNQKTYNGAPTGCVISFPSLTWSSGAAPSHLGARHQLPAGVRRRGSRQRDLELPGATTASSTHLVPRSRTSRAGCIKWGRSASRGGARGRRLADYRGRRLRVAWTLDHPIVLVAERHVDDEASCT
jgi:hypothetical protein